MKKSPRSPTSHPKPRKGGAGLGAPDIARHRRDRKTRNRNHGGKRGHGERNDYASFWVQVLAKSQQPTAKYQLPIAICQLLSCYN